jgi:hypothetical protein
MALSSSMSPVALLEGDPGKGKSCSPPPPNAR